MKGVNSDDVPLKLSHLPVLHFSPIFNQTRLIIPTRINSTSNFNSRFSFQNTQINHIENRSLAYGSYILSLFSESEDPLMHRKHIRLNTKITHHLNLNSLLLFFQRRCDIISNLNHVPIFGFSWRYRFGYHTRIEQSIAMHSVKHF